MASLYTTVEALDRWVEQNFDGEPEAYRAVDIHPSAQGEAVTLIHKSTPECNRTVFDGPRVEARDLIARIRVGWPHLTSNLSDLIDGGRESSVRPHIRRSSP